MLLNNPTPVARAGMMEVGILIKEVRGVITRIIIRTTIENQHQLSSSWSISAGSVLCDFVVSLSNTCCIITSCSNQSEGI